MTELREYRMTRAEMLRYMRIRRGLVSGRPIGRAYFSRLHVFWRELGRKYGFNWRTVCPVPRKGARFFLAAPVADGSKDGRTFPSPEAPGAVAAKGRVLWHGRIRLEELDPKGYTFEPRSWWEIDPEEELEAAELTDADRVVSDALREIDRARESYMRGMEVLIARELEKARQRRRRVRLKLTLVEDDDSGTERQTDE